MTRRNEFVQRIEEAPIIAAVRNPEDLAAAIESDVEVLFLLGGSIITVADDVKRIKNAGKMAIVHMDLVAGLAAKDAAVDYVHQVAHADGIITTKASLIAHARELGLGTVLRYFVLDSMAVANMRKEASMPLRQRPDVIEILPGIIAPKIMRKACQESPVPVIAGGLIKDREDVMNALGSGCIAISTSCHDVWEM